jgi:aspartate aminotransferase
MTGWRIGFAHAPLAVAKAMGNLQDQVTSNPVSFAQFGALAALALPSEEVEKMRAEFDRRRRFLVDGLNAIDGVKCRLPKGAFYAFPDVSAFLGGSVRDDLALADHLLEKAHIAVVPGSVFYGPGHIRLSYACSPEDIEKGVERLSRALADLRP